MYAVIRAGGRQYRVAPGDVIRLEKHPDGSNGKIEFADVLTVSAQDGQITRPKADSARVTGRVLEQGRGDKILVFHFKRKKQYKKLAGHRQPFTAVRITEIAVDGQKFSAPDVEEPKQAKPAASEQASAENKPAAKKSSKPKAGAKKSSAKSAGKKKK